MSLKGHKIDVMRNRLWVPVNTWLGMTGPPTITLIDDGGSPSGGSVGHHTAGALSENGGITGVTGVQPPASVGAGAPVFAEISTFGISGVTMTAGDVVAHMMAIPGHWDKDHPSRIRVVYSTASTTAADKHDWIVLYTGITPEVTELIAPATALDTAIALDDLDSGTAHTIQASAWGVWNAGTLTAANEFLSFSVELDATDAAEVISLYGVQLEFTPKMTRDYGTPQREGEPWEG
jgi:hypothetical protein